MILAIQKMDFVVHSIILIIVLTLRSALLQMNYQMFWGIMPPLIETQARQKSKLPT